jgi:hypothetical protein
MTDQSKAMHGTQVNPVSSEVAQVTPASQARQDAIS